LVNCFLIWFSFATLRNASRALQKIHYGLAQWGFTRPALALAQQVRAA
jgi:hypothetical protein